MKWRYVFTNGETDDWEWEELDPSTSALDRVQDIGEIRRDIEQEGHCLSMSHIEFTLHAVPDEEFIRDRLDQSERMLRYYEESCKKFSQLLEESSRTREQPRTWHEENEGWRL